VFWTWFFVATTVLMLVAFFKATGYWRNKHWELECVANGRAKQLDTAQSRIVLLDSKLDQHILQVSDLSEKLMKSDADLAAARAQLAEALSTRQIAEAELDRTRKALADTEERLRFWMAMADKLDGRCDRATADAVNAREIVADWVAQRTFGRSIFHKAPPLPEESRHKRPIPRARIQGRLAVQLADAAFAKKEAELMAARAGGSQPPAPPEPVRIEVTPDPNP